MIQAIEYNLKRGIKLLVNISDEQYSNCTIPPYYSSIGNHMRHVLDVFSCIFNGLENKEVDLTARERNDLAQKKTSAGIEYFNSIIQQLHQLNSSDFDKIITVKDDLGLGIKTVNYTVASALIQAHSHAVHHYATIGFLVNALDIELPDPDFGYNPTTPREKPLKTI